MISARLGLAILLVWFPATAAAEAIKYSDLLKGDKKLPYGKTIVLTGKLSELTCGSEKLTAVIEATAIQATYLRQKITPAAGTIEVDNWSAPLGVLPPGVSIQLKLKISGAISKTRSGAIVTALVASAQFQRELDHFFNVTVGKGTVLNEEARRFLRNLSDSEGALTGILRQQVPCAVTTEASKVVVSGLEKEFAALANLNSTLKDLIGRNLDAMKGITAPAAAYEVVTIGPLKASEGYTQDRKKLTGNELRAAETAVDQFKEAYEKTREAVAQIVRAELVQAVEMDATVDTSDLEKYAGFDVGAIYVPRIDELRQFFTVNVYPFGPVELGATGLLKGGIRSRLSLAFGMSLGDFSSRQSSRISNENVFLYGIGYRLNKYFRVSAGAAVYREASPRSGLLQEVFVGPSIDITALPGLRQVFARAAPE